MSDIALVVAPWLAVMLTAGAVAMAVAVLSARSLFVMSMALSATAGLTAGALLALYGGDAALSLVLAGSALAPIILLACVLLSARAAKAQQRGVLWISLGAVALAVAAVSAIAPEMLRAETPVRHLDQSANIWLAALMVTVATAVVALLGYDERGVLEPGRSGQEP